MVSEAVIAVEMYQNLKHRYINAGLRPDYLEVTAGRELFNTDARWEPHQIIIRPDGSVSVIERLRMLEPDIPYVLSSLAIAEDELNRYLSGRPSKTRENLERVHRKLLGRRLIHILKDRIGQISGYDTT